MMRAVCISLVGASVLGVSAALADIADVIDVEVTRESADSYRFEVIIRSEETGWDKYADRWEVLGPDGERVGTRVLHHPHVDEQPFTRSLGGVAIPEAITEVTVRAHDSADGYGGAEMIVPLPGR